MTRERRELLAVLGAAWPAGLGARWHRQVRVPLLGERLWNSNGALGPHATLGRLGALDSGPLSSVLPLVVPIILELPLEAMAAPAQLGVGAVQRCFLGP